MSVTDDIRALMDMGAPQQAILAVIAAYEKGVQDGKGIVAVDSAAERRRAYDRERKAEKRSGGNSADIPPDPVSLEKRSPTPPKTQTLSPKENPPNGGQKKVSSKGTRLPADWRLDEIDRAYAESQGVTGAWLDREAQRFPNHWHGKSGKEGLKLDWRATWRNWILGAVERGAPKDLAGTSRTGNLLEFATQSVPQTGPMHGGFYAHRETAQFEAWDPWWRQNKNPAGPAVDKHGGRLFPSEWPPGFRHLEAAE